MIRQLISPRIRAQIIKELLSILRDPRSRVILLGPPLMQLLVFSFAATLEVKHIDLAVLNEDSGRWGFEVSQRLSHAYFVNAVTTARNQPEIEDLVARGKVIAAIHIPSDFSRRVSSQQSAPLQILLDGRKANAAQIAFGYMQMVIAGMNRDIGFSQGLIPERVALRHWFNPNLTYQWFIVPSLGGTLVMFVTLMIAALSIARERELGTFDQLLVSPCSPSEIIFAKIVPAVLMGLLLGVIMLAAGIFVFGIPFKGSFVILLGCLFLFIVSIVGIGLMISSICSTQQQAILGTFTVGVPAVLVSGFATPVENMPRVLQWISEAIPLKHYLIIVQGSFLKALPITDICMNAWPLVIIAAVTLSASTRFVRSRLQ
ncbi:MAG: multidrug transporter permease component [Pseudomonadota bacterium]|jgi:ABC-2 type transport system permease protein